MWGLAHSLRGPREHQFPVLSSTPPAHTPGTDSTKWRYWTKKVIAPPRPSRGRKWVGGWEEVTLKVWARRGTANPRATAEAKKELRHPSPLGVRGSLFYSHHVCPSCWTKPRDGGELI